MYKMYFIYETAELGKDIAEGVLEEILIKAANEVGLSAKSHKTYSQTYKLGSVKRERIHDSTNIRLRRGIIPIAVITIYPLTRKYVDRFGIGRGLFFFAFGSDNLIERYLGAVSRKVNSATTV